MSDPEIYQTVIGDRNIFTGTGDIRITYELPPAAAEDHRALMTLLGKVNQFWVRGVLENSLHGAALLALGKTERPEAIDHPWAQVVELPDPARHTELASASVTTIFDAVGRALLMLGEPGSGKSTTLLELARDTIARAETDPTQPIPVVLNLSTWSQKRAPLLEWLVSELATKYQVSRKAGRAWLEASRLLLLLDGLDEVGASCRADCVAAINRYVEEIGVPGLVVCSRRDEYTALPLRLRLYGAIFLEPLSCPQIDGYLEHAGSELTGLRAALQQDPVLEEMARSPLMLSIMSLAYQGLPAEALTQDDLDTPEERRSRIFEAYVERAFRRKGTGTARPYSEAQTRAGLSWLAGQMRRHHESVFLIEQLQPSWLGTRKQRWVYMLASRVAGGLILGLISTTLDESFLIGPAVGFVAGLMAALMGTLRSERHNYSQLTQSGSVRFWRVTLYVLVHVLLGGLTGLAVLALGLAQLGPEWNAITDGLPPASNKLSNAAPSAFALGFAGLYGAGDGLLCGLVFALRGIERRFENDIRFTNALEWSWARACEGGGRGVLVGLLVGAFIGALGGLFTWLAALKVGDTITSLLVALLVAFCFFVLYTLLIGAAGMVSAGLNSAAVEANDRLHRGIWPWVRNALFGGLRAGLAFFVVFVLPASLFMGFLGGVASAMVIGALSIQLLWPLAILWYGGLDVIQHAILRLILDCSGRIPHHYTQLLNYAVSLVFLRRVGTGYVFVHRLLLEHFAAVDGR